MKRCPTCSRVYDDDNLRFCLDDGTNLVQRSPAEPAPPTLVLPASHEPIPTMKQDFLPDVPPVDDAGPYAGAAAVSKKRNVLIWVAGVVVLVLLSASVVTVGLVIKKKQALRWHLVLAIEPSTPDREAAVRQTVAVIEKRLDAYGLPSYRVTPQDNGQIIIDLPLLTDPERVKALIATAGKLEFVHVISSSNPSPVQTYATKEAALASLNNGGAIPGNRRVLPYSERADAGGAPASKKWVVVESPAIVDGGELHNSAAVRGRGDYDDYEINFSLNKDGADKFGRWTGMSINEYLGVVLNDEVRSIAYIKSQIFDSGVIEGHFTKQSAEDLALVLKAGALPAPIRYVEERIDK